MPRSYREALDRLSSVELQQLLGEKTRAAMRLAEEQIADSAFAEYAPKRIVGREIVERKLELVQLDSR